MSIINNNSFIKIFYDIIKSITYYSNNKLYYNIYYENVKMIIIYYI